MGRPLATGNHCSRCRYSSHKNDQLNCIILAYSSTSLLICLGVGANASGVVLGGIIGHAMCTGMAVVGGKLLATRISGIIIMCVDT